MAHNLEIRNGEASMFYVNEPPWHKLGRKLAAPATAEEAIQAAKLDWEVAKVPLYAAGNARMLPVQGKFGIVRKDKWGSDDCTVLGVVGEQYTPLQNREAFTFFDPIVGQGAAVYHTAGVLGAGERIWILAKLPDSITVKNGDITDKFLLLSNSHDGESAVQVKFTPIRVVCENTLTMALGKGKTIRVAHTKNVQQRLKEAQRLLGIIRDEFAEIEKDFNKMAEIEMDDDRLGVYFGLVFPDPVDPDDRRGAERAAKQRSWARRFFANGKGNRDHGIEGTLWAAYNGVTEFIDHRKTQQSDEGKLSSLWFGNGCSIKARAYRMAKEKMEGWLS